MRKTMPLRPALLALAITAVLISGCDNAHPPAGRAPAPAPVHTQIAQLQDYRPAATVIGKAVASAQVDIKAKTTGLLEAKHFADGNAVEQGQILFTVEQTGLDLSLKKAEAQFQNARASLDQLTREERRQANLLASNAASKQAHDDALSARLVQQEAVKAALAARDLARKELNDSLIKAPFTGRLGQATVSVGDYLTPSQNLVTLTAISPMWVTFSLSQPQFNTLFPSGLDNALVKVILEDGAVIDDAVLDYSAPDVDSLYGTVTLRASLSNDDDRLKPGQYVQVSVSGVTQQGVSLIPLKAVQQSSTGTFVYVVENAKAQKKPIQAMDWEADQFQVTKGLEQDTPVILDNLLKLYPGADVKVIEDTPATAGAK
jgi:membrane fusion protein (multidrug efflux system)